MPAEFLNKLSDIFKSLRETKKKEYGRVLPFGDYFSDRFEKAKYLGFGKGSSVYDNVVVIGDVKVGENTWIGPNVILDGSGGLKIGSNCSVSGGVQIYSHDSVEWALSGGKEKYEYGRTEIGDNCYIGPNTVVAKGITVGNNCVIGANSFVNISLPQGSKAYGNPAKIHK